MSTRRQNENLALARKPLHPLTTKKPILGENSKPLTVSGKTATSKPSKSDDNQASKTNPKAPRRALASIVNNTPQQSRAVPRKPVVTVKPAPLKSLTSTPAKPILRATKSISIKAKALSVYTPARAKAAPENRSEDELEYMPPTAIDRPYEPPTPMRKHVGENDAFFAPTPRKGCPPLDLSLLGEPIDPLAQQSLSLSPDLPAIQLADLLDESEFQLDTDFILDV
ncbi:hypothetical protein P7C73_g1626, partial [Tremellales sp. Uapishka_1]